MSYKKVIDCFLEYQDAHTPKRNINGGYYSWCGCTLTSKDNELISYKTTIAYFKDNILYINNSKYSSTTSKCQSYLRYKAIEKNISIKLY